jgi:membrane protein
MKQPASKGTELKLFAKSLVPSFVLLRRNDPLRLAGATAFFTTFALPPIVFILARLFGFFAGPGIVGKGLIQKLGNNLGDEGAQQVRGVIRSIRGFSDNKLLIVPGFIFLLFVATTLFNVIKNSLEQIWGVDASKRSILQSLGTRLKSIAVILFVGLLFFADLFFKSIETMGGNYVQEIFGGGSVYFQIVFSEITGVLIVSAWFVILFRYLAAARPHWKAALIGGLLTGLLFSAGRIVLRALLVEGNVGVLYGASGSLVLVLLFVFYTSFIIYYGACFIKVYSDKKGWVLGVKKEGEAIKEESADGQINTSYN